MTTDEAERRLTLPITGPVAPALAAFFLIASGGVAQAAPSPPAETSQSCEGVPPQPTELEGARSFTYGSTGKRDLRVHVISPAPASRPRPAIMFFFGGGFRNGQVDVFKKQALAFAGHGYIAVLADYRVLCRDGTNPAASVADGRAAWAWLQAHASELGADPERLVISGGSAGGLVAAATAMLAPAKARPAAAVLFNPGLDLRPDAAGRGLGAGEAASVSPAALPLTALPQTIIFHGRADRMIPIQQERDFCAAVSAAGGRCELVEYEGYGHSFYHVPLVSPKLGRSPFEDTMERSFAFLDRVIGPPPASQSNAGR